jgi:hypothetical protein
MTLSARDLLEASQALDVVVDLRRISENPETARRYMRRAALLDSLNSANAVR